MKSRMSSLVYEISKDLTSDINKKNRNKQILLKKKILNMDGRCEYCETQTVSKKSIGDHYMPLVKNKMPTEYCHEPINTIPVCAKCNSSKGASDFFTWYKKSTYCKSIPSAIRRRVLKKMSKYHDIFLREHNKKRFPKKKLASLIKGLQKQLDKFTQDVSDIKKHVSMQKIRNH